MTARSDADIGATEAEADDRTADAAAEAAFRESMQQFAEGATALTAASIRMQMMMLEQAREMMDDFAELFGGAAAGGDTETQGSNTAKKGPASHVES